MKKVSLGKFQQKCGGGRCPKILLDEKGNALVQGAKVDKVCVAGLNVPEHEDVVFIPKDVIAEFLANCK